MFLTLIRHTSVAVLPGYCYGQSDVDISTTFQTEAKQVLSKLQGNSFDAVYSSPLSRCRKLANYCGFKEPILDDRLMELNFGDWEMKAWTEIEDTQLQRWFDNWVYEAPTRGESFQSLLNRVEEFLLEIKKLPIQRAVLFTHSGIFRSVEVIINRLSVAEAFDNKVEYGDCKEFIL